MEGERRRTHCFGIATTDTFVCYWVWTTRLWFIYSVVVHLLGCGSSTHCCCIPDNCLVVFILFFVLMILLTILTLLSSYSCTHLARTRPTMVLLLHTPRSCSPPQWSYSCTHLACTRPHNGLHTGLLLLFDTPLSRSPLQCSPFA